MQTLAAYRCRSVETVSRSFSGTVIAYFATSEFDGLHVGSPAPCQVLAEIWPIATDLWVIMLKMYSSHDLFCS